jgi:hypothetical protein
MASTRKIEINRINSQASTGPKSAQGKARAAQNALRHGLSLSIDLDPKLSEQIESLAHEIVGETRDREIYECARQIAEAQIDLNRIRKARDFLLAYNIDHPERGMTELSGRNAQPRGPQKVVGTVLELTKRLIVIGRYEQRALSRRKFAIRAFDLACRQASQVSGPPLAAAVQKYRRW